RQFQKAAKCRNLPHISGLRVFQRRLHTEGEFYHRDENGDPVMDENGDPVMEDIGSIRDEETYEQGGGSMEALYEKWEGTDGGENDDGLIDQLLENPNKKDSFDSDADGFNPEDPSIYHITSDTRVDENVRGIIIVDDGATLSFKGNEYFEGLIYVRSGGKLDMRGTPRIAGAVIADELSLSDHKGTPTIMYSSEALSRVGSQYFQSADFGDIASWRQL
ncbi:hypothetical protein, partial [Arhodomonas sp. SL1]|uniref:hypothetical protein n=1 Tax=Arhodomonas sp. SL1 TaxID=3425691 RepID=UPI003F8838A4